MIALINICHSNINEKCSRSQGRLSKLSRCSKGKWAWASSTSTDFVWPGHVAYWQSKSNKIEKSTKTARVLDYVFGPIRDFTPSPSVANAYPLEA